MSGLLEPRLAPALERLQRFWLWKRRQLVQEVHAHIRTADAYTLRLTTHGKALQAVLEKTAAEHSQLQLTHAAQTEQLAERNAAHQSLSAAHEELRAKAANLHQECGSLTAQNTALQQQLQTAHATLAQWQSAHQTLRAEHQHLQEAYTAQTQRLGERDAEHHRLSAAHELLQAEAAELRKKFSDLTTQHAALEKQLATTNAELLQWQSAHQRLEAAHRQLQSDHADLEGKLIQRNAEYRQLAEIHDNQSNVLASREEALGQLQSAHEDLSQAHTSLYTKRLRLLAKHCKLRSAYQLVQYRYDLVCAILSCSPADNPALQHLQYWLAEDFVQDVQRLELPAKATTHALEQARAIAQHVELLADAPALHDKFLVAVAGGFSSGKSSFVSSFMAREAATLLPTDIKPVTAIPTYVMPGEALVIEGHTFKGAHVPLTPEAYGNLTHDFIAEMGCNVKEIMPYVVLQSPMPRLKHLAFIDMPGYNPAQSEVVDTAADQSIASAALTEADAVIWLLGLDSNGTLSGDDITFLLEHADASKPLYVVLNKADLRPENAVIQILAEIKNNLDSVGIVCEGISAYSALWGKELFHDGKSLQEVLTQWDHHSSAAAAVHKEFESLMDGLEAASQLGRKNTEDVRALVHSLRLDLVELSAQKGGGTEAWAALRFVGGAEGRAQRLGEGIEEKLQRLQKAVATTAWDEATSVLKKAREHGHELLRHACDVQEPPATFAHANGED